MSELSSSQNNHQVNSENIKVSLSQKSTMNSSTNNQQEAQENQETTDEQSAVNENQEKDDHTIPAVENTSEIYYPFDPQDHGLDKNFSLISYGDIRDKLVRPNHHDIQAYLTTFINTQVDHPITLLTEETTIMKLSNNNYYLLETSNFITPMLNEPYYLGKAAFVNIMSGIYAFGIAECTTHRMAISIPSTIDIPTRNIIIPLITQGYLDAAAEAHVSVQGIRIINSSSFLIGGNATSIILEQQILRRDIACPGDIIILTKPLGTAVAIALSQYIEDPIKRKEIIKRIKLSDVLDARYRALDVMVRSNLYPAVLMRKYAIHAVCEISTHGLYGHADVLVKKQLQPVDFVINNLPIISKMDVVAKSVGLSGQLMAGRLPEISGGLLVVMSKDHGVHYCQTITQDYGGQAWIIGSVEPGNGSVLIKNLPKIISVPEIEKKS